MDGEALKHFLKIPVELRKKGDYTLLRGFIKEVYLDSILFVSQGRERLIDFDEIGEIRQINRNASSSIDDFYYQGNGKESWKR